MAGNSILAKMAVQITAQNAEFARAMQKSQRDLSSFVGGVTKMAGALGVAFGVQQIADFTLHVSKLSGEAKAVRAAFERLPESTRLMLDLKQATGGTVSELSLMKRAVQASNFDISLKALPRLLEFATLRAQQTGQSVDYLVDSIVTGIGRKSKLILDNLGISAVSLNEALGGTSTAMASVADVANAVGKIAEENLKNMEGFSENASTKIQRLTASWENLKVAIGDTANETGILGTTIDAITGSMDLLASRDLSFWEKVLAGVGGPGAAAGALLEDFIRKQERANKESKKQEQIIQEVDRAFKEFNGDIDAYGAAITTHIYKAELLAEFTKRLTQAEDERVITLGELRETEKELNDLFTQTDITDKKKLQNTAAEISGIREKIKAIEDLLKVEKAVAEHQLSQTTQRALAGEAVTGTTSISGFGMIRGVDNKAIFERMESLRNKSAEVTQDISDDFIDMSGIVAGSISQFAAGLGQALVGVENFGDVILSSIGGFMQSFGASLIAMGIGKIALEKFSGPAMIAAGFALTAAGAALSASISGGPNLSGGGGGSTGRGVNPFRANTSVQNSSPQLQTVIRGEDLWIVLQNYQSNNRFTRG